MKNPFEKKDHKALIAGVVIGSVVAGTAAYLFLTETGSTVRQQLTGHFNRILAAVSGTPEALPEEDHSTDYMHPKQKAPKTDRKALLKHELLSNGRHEDVAHEGEAS